MVLRLWWLFSFWKAGCLGVGVLCPRCRVVWIFPMPFSGVLSSMIVMIMGFARISAVFASSSSVFRFIVVCVGSISGVWKLKRILRLLSARLVCCFRWCFLRCLCGSVLESFSCFSGVRVVCCRVCAVRRLCVCVPSGRRSDQVFFVRAKCPSSFNQLSALWLFRRLVRWVRLCPEIPSG